MLSDTFVSFFSHRLTLAPEDGGRRSPAIAVAVGGVALSVAVMMIAIAVTSGFKKEISDKITGFEAQLRVVPVAAADGRNVVDCSGAFTQVVSEALEPFVSGEIPPEVVPVANCAGLLKTPDNFAGVMFKAYGNGAEMQFEQSNMLDGVLPSDSGNARGIVISDITAKELKLSVGDRVNSYFFADGNIRSRRYDIVGIYSSGFGEFDRLMAYMPKSAIDNLLRISASEGGSVEIRGLAPEHIEEATWRLQNALNMAFAEGILPALYNVVNVYAAGAVYFNWLAMLDTNIVVVLVLMGCVSGFMLISCLLILILQRVRMIGLLKAMGATDGQIKAVFIRLGFRVLAAGLLAGNVLAIALLASESMWHWLPLDPESYYLSYVPVNLTAVSWFALNAGVTLFAMMLMFLPVVLVARLQISRTMRWE